MSSNLRTPSSHGNYDSKSLSLTDSAYSTNATPTVPSNAQTQNLTLATNQPQQQPSATVTATTTATATPSQHSADTIAARTSSVGERAQVPSSPASLIPQKSIKAIASSSRAEKGDALTALSVMLKDEMRNRLRLTGILCAFAALVHIAVTIIAFAMAYTPPPNSDTYSVTGVVCAFGCMNTVVFAVVTSYDTFSFSIKSELPSWERINSTFLDAVMQSFFLIFFMFPSLVVFVIHEKGSDIFSVLSNLRSTNASSYSVIVFHIISICFVILVDCIQILVTSGRLFVAQAPRREAEEDDVDRHIRSMSVHGPQQPPQPQSPVPSSASLTSPTLAGVSLMQTSGASGTGVQLAELTHRNTKSSTAGTMSPSGDFDGVVPMSSIEEEKKTSSAEIEEKTWKEDFDIRVPVRDFDYVLFAAAFFVKIMFTIDLLVATILTGNSGPTITFICHFPFVCVWCYGVYRFGYRAKLHEFSEQWLTNYRLFMIFHFACSICFFWITLAIIILVEYYDSAFFASIGNFSSNTAALCYMMLVLFLVVVVLYAAVLFLWSKAMWGVDEISRMRLVERARNEKTKPPIAL